MRLHASAWNLQYMHMKHVLGYVISSSLLASDLETVASFRTCVHKNNYSTGEIKFLEETVYAYGTINFC